MNKVCNHSTMACWVSEIAFKVASYHKFKGSGGDSPDHTYMGFMTVIML